MDEVLTHLDASGREAVGHLLRKVARTRGGGGEIEGSGAAAAGGSLGAGSSEAGSPVGDGIEDGSHGTVLVILQDLAASELEESFDSVDVVRKLGDVARLEMDS
jgi:hypothetical protein